MIKKPSQKSIKFEDFDAWGKNDTSERKDKK